MAAPRHASDRGRRAQIARVRILAPLRGRDFAVLWAGMTVSLLGDGIYFVAIAWEALRLSNTTVAISLVGVAWMLPTVAFLLIGGILSDRLDRRRLMVAATLLQAAAIAGIGTLIVLGTIRLWTLLALVAVYGAADAFFLPAFEAIVPSIVAPRDVAHASALDQFIRPLALQLVGPAIGGILIAAAGTGVAFLVDAASFLFATRAILAMRGPGQVGSRVEAVEPPLAAIAAAVRFVRANAWLARTLVAAALTLLLFVGPSQVLLPYVIKDVLHAGSGSLGAVRACGGVGAVLAAVAVSQRGVSGWPLRAMLVGWAVQCLMLTGYAVAANAWLFAALALISGAFGAGANVIWGTLLKSRVPNEMLGRVASLDLLVSIGLIPVSFAITGPVATALGATTTLFGSGILAAATMLLFALTARPPAPGVGRTTAAGRTRHGLRVANDLLARPAAVPARTAGSAIHRNAR